MIVKVCFRRISDVNTLFFIILFNNIETFFVKI